MTDDNMTKQAHPLGGAIVDIEIEYGGYITIDYYA